MAASLVVFYHASRHLDKDLGYTAAKHVFQFGHSGVDFFFVISGFIILFVHGGDCGRPDRLGHYAERRFTRIFPAYWTILAVTIVSALLSSHQAMPSLGSLMVAVTLFPAAGEPLVGVAWTLQHEMMFYAIFATLIVHRRAGLALFVLWLGMVICGQFTTVPFLPDKAVSAYNIEFFFGMAAAQWLRSREVPCARLVLSFGLAAFAAAAAAEVTGLLDGYAWPARLAYGLPSMLIILGLVEVERSGKITVPGPLQKIGSASYSIYLFHLFCLGIFYKAWSVVGLLGRMPLWITFIAIVAAGILGGVAVSQMVEYPLMRLVRHKTARLVRARATN